MLGPDDLPRATSPSLAAGYLDAQPHSTPRTSDPGGSAPLPTMIAESRPHPLRLSAIENGPPVTVRMRPTEDTERPATDGGAYGAPLTRPQRSGGTIVAPVAAPTGSSRGRADAPATTMPVKRRAFLTPFGPWAPAIPGASLWPPVRRWVRAQRPQLVALGGRHADAVTDAQGGGYRSGFTVKGRVYMRFTVPLLVYICGLPRNSRFIGELNLTAGTCCATLEAQ